MKRDHETGEVIRDHADLQAKYDLLREAASEACSQLKAAAELRVGAMDSQSRAEEISGHMRSIVSSCAERLLAALES